MPELLQRVTHMKVAQVKDGVRVQPDRVYVIPPNKDLSILGGLSTCSTRPHREACACPSTTSFVRWQTTSGSEAWESSFPAWARTGRSASRR